MHQFKAITDTVPHTDRHTRALARRPPTTSRSCFPPYLSVVSRVRTVAVTVCPCWCGSESVESVCEGFGKSRETTKKRFRILRVELNEAVLVGV